MFIDPHRLLCRFPRKHYVYGDFFCMDKDDLMYYLLRRFCCEKYFNRAGNIVRDKSYTILENWLMAGYNS